MNSAQPADSVCPSSTSPEPTRTKRIPRAIREQQMLDAAIHVFAEHGYRAASMDAIAQRASTSKPMLYLYHGSKEELFSACVTRETDRLMDALQKQVDPDDTPHERLKKVIHSFLGYVEANADSWNLVYRQAAAEPIFRDTVERSRSQFVDLTTALLERSAPALRAQKETEIIAIALVGAGETVADRVASHSISLDDATSILVQFTWTGLAGTRPSPKHSQNIATYRPEENL